MDTGHEHCDPGSQHVSCRTGEGRCRSKGKAHAAGWLPQLLLRKHCLELLPGDMSGPDRKRGWQAPFSKPRACLPDRIWIEWLALREPRLIGLKEKKCYFSSPKTTKRNGETKILFRLNKDRERAKKRLSVTWAGSVPDYKLRFYLYALG